MHVSVHVCGSPMHMLLVLAEALATGLMQAVKLKAHVSHDT